LHFYTGCEYNRLFYLLAALSDFSIKKQTVISSKPGYADFRKNNFEMLLFH